MPKSNQKAVRARVGGMSLESSPEWREWLKRLAEKERCKSVQLLDRLAAEHAARIGFEVPPPRCRPGSGGG